MRERERGKVADVSDRTVTYEGSDNIEMKFSSLPLSSSFSAI